ncbi:hypothetical protein KFK09_013274 [Dendrobium nobile]|uniref:Uncharacterized protein n=1 Tax=Dendrobium nobile TaxID=94219 RepID=A0A8T3B896_DENNO|nr:hypothetical protein KFK09_013274 [Dendrobium nobile]
MKRMVFEDVKAKKVTRDPIDLVKELNFPRLLSEPMGECSSFLIKESFQVNFYYSTCRVMVKNDFFIVEIKFLNLTFLI